MLFPQLSDIINPGFIMMKGISMSKKLKPRVNYDSYIGTKINKWTIVSYAYSKNRMHFNCVCDCGLTSFIQAAAVIYGNSKQCKKCNLLINGTKKIHGHYGTPTNRTWNALRNRCNNPQNKNYEHYGGRGIRVCEHWNIYENFLADMGEKPIGLSIDRINNDGHYEPGNCRWATASIQNSNQRRRRIKKVT